MHFITYRALHAGRNALIGQNLIAVSSHCHALCLPVGGASLANDGRSECGVNKCGEALHSTSRSALRCMPLCVCFYFYSTVVIVHTLALILFFIFYIYIYILLYFNIYLLNERRRPSRICSHRDSLPTSAAVNGTGWII